MPEIKVNLPVFVYNDSHISLKLLYRHISDLINIHGFIVNSFFKLNVIVLLCWIQTRYIAIFVALCAYYQSKCIVSFDWSIYDDRMFPSSAPREHILSVNSRPF